MQNKPRGTQTQQPRRQPNVQSQLIDLLFLRATKATFLRRSKIPCFLFYFTLQAPYSNALPSLNLRQFIHRGERVLLPVLSSRTLLNHCRAAFFSASRSAEVTE